MLELKLFSALSPGRIVYQHCHMIPFTEFIERNELRLCCSLDRMERSWSAVMCGQCNWILTARCAFRFQNSKVKWRRYLRCGGKDKQLIARMYRSIKLKRLSSSAGML